jgi:hypothetical protein
MNEPLLIGAAEPLGLDTEELLHFAVDKLGYRRYTGEKPGAFARTLVWLDLLSTDDAPEARAPTRNWQKAGGEALVICGTDVEPRGGAQGPLLTSRLLPREQLRSLAWRSSGTPETLDAHYRECPADYAADTGEASEDFVIRLLEGIPGRERDQDKSAQSGALFKAALTRLSTEGRWRDFDDLLVVLDETLPTDIKSNEFNGAAIPTLEAAVCIRRARHRWWRHGADLPPKPLMLVRAAPDAVAAMDWEARQAVLRSAALFLPAGAPVPTADKFGLREDKTSVAKVHFPTGLRPQHWAAATPEQGYRLANQAWSAALSQLLVRGRPLREYGCTLLFPFDPGPAEEVTFRRMLDRASADTRGPGPILQDTGEVDQDARQARLYFLPHIRQLLFESDRARGRSTLTPIREWGLPADTERPWRVTLRDTADGEAGRSDRDEDVTAAVTSVRLLRYYNGIYLLALRLELPTAGPALEPLDAGDAQWWQPLVFGSEDDYELLRGRTLARWLRFTNQVRVLYPTFVEQHQEGKLPTLELWAGDKDLLGRFQPQQAVRADRTPMPGEARSLLSAIAHEPLQQFFGNDDRTRAEALALIKATVTLHDARCFVSVVYAPAGPALPEPGGAPQTRSGARPEHGAAWDAAQLFALALYVDRFEDLPSGGNDHFVYDPDWISRDLPKCSLGLWDARGMRAGFTDSANVYLGSSPVFARIVAPRHVPLIYERMLAMALFYRATLRRFNARISDATEALDKPQHEQQFRELREEFIEFTNRYWFRELSAEMQGRQIFALQQRGLDLDAAYAELKDEMERADEFLAARRAAWEQHLASRVGWVAFGLAILGVLLTYLPLLQGPDGQSLPMMQAVFLDVPGATPWARLGYLLGPLATLALATIAVTLFFWATLGGGLKRGVERAKTRWTGGWWWQRKPRR